MYKGLFQPYSEEKGRQRSIKSYLKKQSLFAKQIAVCFAILALASC